ncbi:L-fucose mutarotase [Sodalis glossinidius str. 'morsitans']|uniref:Fucose operon protein n=1 Tax=Sodalis glossinidius (strain morsitans) TaxID=343509 RepID=Q2NWM1_SODGM|nr:L-fucose mutarotase [Sodalis glossinidius]BAE73454.1 fucose operon protein [Sodalis glossinidius str. 'morsitans']CRL43806.1 L-fucose mutarotase [Sodalis glossinidius str. 'morsitans']
MLKILSPLISPDLLKTLSEMGHGDEIIFADAHFPAHRLNPHVIRADGLRIADLLAAIAPLFALDSYAPPVVMMAPVDGDVLDLSVELRYRQALFSEKSGAATEWINREAFYQRAGTAYALVVTGEAVRYGNILLKKGITF